MPTTPPGDLTEFKRFLRKSNAPVPDSEDAELELVLVAATEAVEGWGDIGPIVPRPVTDRLRTNDIGVLVLEKTPVLSVTHATSVPGGTVVDGDDLDVSKRSGIIRGLPRGVWDVTYEAGRDPVPDALKTATFIIGKHMWETQRGPKGRLRGENEEETRAQWTGAGYLIPNRAAHLMEPYATVAVA